VRADLPAGVVTVGDVESAWPWRAADGSPDTLFFGVANGSALNVLVAKNRYVSPI
jgi:hypothetical protein